MAAVVLNDPANAALPARRVGLAWLWIDARLVNGLLGAAARRNARLLADHTRAVAPLGRGGRTGLVTTIVANQLIFDLTPRFLARGALAGAAGRATLFALGVSRIARCTIVVVVVVVVVAPW